MVIIDETTNSAKTARQPHSLRETAPSDLCREEFLHSVEESRSGSRSDDTVHIIGRPGVPDYALEMSRWSIGLDVIAKGRYTVRNRRWDRNERQGVNVRVIVDELVWSLGVSGFQLLSAGRANWEAKLTG